MLPGGWAGALIVRMPSALSGIDLVRGWSLGAGVGEYVVNRRTGELCRVLASDGVLVTARAVTEREVRALAAEALDDYRAFYARVDTRLPTAQDGSA